MVLSCIEMQLDPVHLILGLPLRELAPPAALHGLGAFGAMLNGVLAVAPAKTTRHEQGPQQAHAAPSSGFDIHLLLI